VKTFVSKLLEDGKSKREVTRHLANVHDKVNSYVSKYKESSEKYTTRTAVYREPNYERNVHFFCTAKHGIQVSSSFFPPLSVLGWTSALLLGD